MRIGVIGVCVAEIATHTPISTVVELGTSTLKSCPQKIKDVDQLNRSKMSSNEPLLFNNQRARRLNVRQPTAAKLYLLSEFRNCSF